MVDLAACSDSWGALMVDAADTGFILATSVAVCECGWDSWGSPDDPETAGAKHQEDTGHVFDENHVSD